MKWFLAVNEPGISGIYSGLMKVAVQTALEKTSLEPYIIYDGEDNEHTDWLVRKGVKLIKHRSFLYPYLEKMAELLQDPLYLKIGSGAFLRVEIPQVVFDQGITDTYVLYTDCDVMFLDDVVDQLSHISCPYFAVAPQRYINNYRAMNSGVMLMNLPRLRSDLPKFKKFMIENIDRCREFAFDQGMYILYYRTIKGLPRRPGLLPNRLIRSGKLHMALRKKPLCYLEDYLWDHLPPEFNWKPYWERTDRAKIIHFHGPKPNQRDRIRAGKAPRIHGELAHGQFDVLSDQWQAVLDSITLND